MKGHVEKKRGRYFVVVELDKDPATGKRRRKWSGGFARKKDADAALTQALHQRQEGTYVPPAKTTLQQFLRGWLVSIKPTLRASSWESYRLCVEERINPALGQIELRRLNAMDLNGLYARLLERGRRDGKGGLAPRTVRLVHVTLHRALRDAVRWGLLSRNVADLADPPKQQQPDTRAWSGEDLRAFLEGAATDRMYAAFLMAAATGMRRGEILGLRWTDVDLELGRIAIRQTLIIINYKPTFSEPKTDRSRRSLRLDPATLAALKSWRARQLEERLAWGSAWTDTGLVFTGEDGTLIHPQSLSDAFERRTRNLALPSIRFHDLRHTWATLSLQAGVPLWAVSDILGHGSISITDSFYRHAVPSMLDEATGKVAGIVFGDSGQPPRG